MLRPASTAEKRTQPAKASTTDQCNAVSSSSRNPTFRRVAFPRQLSPPAAKLSAHSVPQFFSDPPSNSRAATVPPTTLDNQKHHPNPLCRRESHQNLIPIRYSRYPQHSEYDPRDPPRRK